MAWREKPKKHQGLFRVFQVYRVIGFIGFIGLIGVSFTLVWGFGIWGVGF